MASALGQLPNAPLIYVLAQVVFTRVPKMGSHWEDFHQAIFDRYPNAVTEQVRQIQLQDGDDAMASNLVRWSMFDQEKREGVILASESLILHTTSYTTSENFISRLEFVLTKLADILPENVEVNRLGLRYVDLLLPSEGLPVDEQVSGKLGSISLDEAGCDFLKLEEVTRYRTPENGDLVIRHRQSVDADILPGDLFPTHLVQAPLLERKKPEEGVTAGLIDYDHYVHLESEFNPSVIIAKFKAMHTTSSNAFKMTTTPEARQLWSEA